MASASMTAIISELGRVVSPCLSFFNLHFVASFASSSAASFPGTPVWAGTERVCSDFGGEELFDFCN